ncbi:MAG: SdpI family protein [Candidatus Nanoarchaeia archaeon]
MRKYIVYSVVLIVLSIIIGMYVYNALPDKVASHWNARGEVDNYMPKFWGVFLMPLISIFLLLLFIFLPRTDPLWKNMKQFREKYDFFIAIVLSFLFYLYLLTLLWNKGLQFNMVVFILPAFALLFFYIGVIIQNAPRNWFLGIRNPWTMSDDIVWAKTHKLAGWLFKICALLALLGMFIPSAAILIFIIPLLIAVIVMNIYSYRLFRKLKKNKENKSKKEKKRKK